MALKVTEIPLLDNLVLLGPPGVGKSEVIREAARREAIQHGRVFLDIRESLSRGTSIEELARRVEKEPRRYYLYLEVPLSELVTEYFIGGGREMREILRLYAVDGVEGVLVVDGLNALDSNEAVSVAASLVGEKRLGTSLALQPTVKVVLLGYTPEYGGLQDIPVALVVRATVLRVEPPSLEEWYWYMVERFSPIMPDYYASLLARARRAIEEGGRELGVNILAAPVEFFAGGAPTPRSWTRLVLTLAGLHERLRNGEISVEEYRRYAGEVIRGTLGSKIAGVVEKYLVGGAITSDALLELFRRGRDGLRDLLREAFEEEGELKSDIMEALRGLDALYAYRVLRLARTVLDSIEGYARGRLEEGRVAKSIERFVKETNSLLRDIRSLLELVLAVAVEDGRREVIDVVLGVDDRIRETMLKLAERVEALIREHRRSIEALAGGERGGEALKLIDGVWDGFNRIMLSPYTPLRSVISMG